MVFSIVDNNTEYFYYTSCELEYQPFELLQVDMTNVDILDYCVDTNGEIFYLELEAQEGQEKIFLKKNWTGWEYPDIGLSKRFS